MSEETDVTLVVMERGAEWPSCIEACRRVTPNTVVIAQDDDELPEALARRVDARLRSLLRENRPVRASVLAVSSRHGDVVSEQRSQVARSLLSALSDEGTLWLSAPVAVPDAVRHYLIALAGTLTSFLGSSGVAIAVRFTERTLGSSQGAGVRSSDRVEVQLASAS